MHDRKPEWAGLETLRKNLTIETEIRKRSVTLSGHRTSVSLETAFWTTLKNIARAEKISLNCLISEIDRTRTGNLSSAVRVYVLNRLAMQTHHLEQSPEH